jgi:alpha-galactosidase
MIHSMITRFLCIAAAMALPALAQNAPAPAAPAAAPAANPLVLTIDAFKTAPPFSFVYGGKPSSALLPTWQRSEDTKAVDGGEIHTITWLDPATQLKVTAEVRTFTDFPALDWLVSFSNGGAADTPILEQIESLDWTRPCPTNSPECATWYGGNGGGEDFNPSSQGLNPDAANPTHFQSAFGRSSRSTLPYFNFTDGNYNGSGIDYGPGGVAVGIGWTGNWSAKLPFDPNAKTVRFVAGMQASHLLLHAGESIRTPRIVELSWTGDRKESPAQWHRLMLRHYAPQPAAGHDISLPILFAGGGGKTDERVAQIGALQTAKINCGLYGLVNWAKARGSWTPDPAAFPNGLKPLSDAAKAAGMGMMLYMEPEVADAGSDLLTQHPEWFFPAKGDQPAILDFGNPAARKAMTDLVSQLVTDSGATYFHHFISDVHLDEKWAAADKPDRVGMTEINYITGLYQFWDDLERQHPGLLIDQPGWRLDVETAKRGTEIWGNTYGHPQCNQMQIAELTPWFPLTGGLFNITPPDLPKTPAAQLYVWRSAYGPDTMLNSPMPMDGSFAPVIGEIHRVQPLLLGDFYLLSQWDIAETAGMAWQANRPDLKAGVVLALRRSACPFAAVQPMLRGIDPAATYDVEICEKLGPGTTQQMSGADLIKIQIPLSGMPSSTLVFYKQR